MKRSFQKIQKALREANVIYEPGTKVKKFTDKPFKSGAKTNTVKGVINSPYKIDPETGEGVPSYTFVEDESIVECTACIKVE